MKFRITQKTILRCTALALAVIAVVLIVVLLVKNSGTPTGGLTPTPTGTVSPFLPTDTPVPTQSITSEPTGTQLPSPTVSAEEYARRRREIMLVNLDHRLEDSFEPSDLVYISDYLSTPSVRIRSSEAMISATAINALRTMFDAAHRDGINGYVLSTAYRTYAFQQMLYEKEQFPVNDKGYYMVFPPYASEHRTGLAFDVTNEEFEQGRDPLLEAFGTSAQGLWLKEHCWEYGFIIRYPVGKESITRTNYEPWHLRYVGVEHALAMKASGECLEEYLGYAN